MTPKVARSLVRKAFNVFNRGHSWKCHHVFGCAMRSLGASKNLCFFLGRDRMFGTVFLWEKNILTSSILTGIRLQVVSRNPFRKCFPNVASSEVGFDWNSSPFPTPMQWVGWKGLKVSIPVQHLGATKILKHINFMAIVNLPTPLRATYPPPQK